MFLILTPLIRSGNGKSSIKRTVLILYTTEFTLDAMKTKHGILRRN